MKMFHHPFKGKWDVSISCPGPHSPNDFPELLFPLLRKNILFHLLQRDFAVAGSFGLNRLGAHGGSID